MSDLERCLKCGGLLARKRLEQDPRYCSITCNWWDLRAEIARLREENERLRAPDGGSGVEAWRRCYARLDERFAKLSEAIDNLVIIRDGQDA